MKTHLIDLKGGGHIALHRLDGPHRGPATLLAHGTMSDSTAIADLGHKLQQEGMDCWLLDWGGQGKSAAAQKRQNFEAPALLDVPAAIEAVRQHTGQDKITWVSHSGGGLLPLMYLARHPKAQEHIQALVTMGAQATDAGKTTSHRLRAHVLKVVTQTFGYTPKAILPPGCLSEPTALLAQWSTWNLAGRWLGADGFDYLPALAQIHIPLLCIAGGADDIAPATGCRRLFDAIGSHDKTWVLCAKSKGFSKDFHHGSLVRGGSARREIDPILIEWLKPRLNT